MTNKVQTVATPTVSKVRFFDPGDFSMKRAFAELSGWSAPWGLRPAASREKEKLMFNHKCILANHAHRMRLAPTDTEATLWRSLRARQQLGVAFRRQVPLLRFIVDFFAPSARLVIEVDGGYHDSRRAADARRDEKLRRAGYRVLRLDAGLVRRDLPAALALVVAELAVKARG